jgi:GNAT superfamily N-acetyltransferase
VHIEVVPPDATQAARQLAAVLLDSVAGGASVGFLASLTADAAERWWSTQLADPGATTLWAREGDRVLGTVTLRPATMDNARHRAEVGKLLVLQAARGRGIATALMHRLEELAAGQGRWLLLLDTETDSPAERLYHRLGWEVVGIVPDHAAGPGGALAPTTFLRKALAR